MQQSGYVDGDSFLIDIVFEAASETNKIILPTHAPSDNEVNDISIIANGFTVVEILSKSATVFEARLRRNSATSGEAEIISVDAGSPQFIYTPAAPDAPAKDTARATVTFDSDAPAISNGEAVDESAPEIQALGGRFIPLNGEWADPVPSCFYDHST